MPSQFPWFPLASAIATGLGLGGLCWYSTLSSEDQERADALTAQYAQRLYDRTADELTVHQRDHIDGLVRHHFPN